MLKSIWSRLSDGLMTLHADPLHEQLAPIGHRQNRIVGPVLASTNTTTGISPAYAVQHVSGTQAINQIAPPYTGFQGTIILIPDAAFTGVTTGTGSGPIGLAFTAVTGKALALTFDGAAWYPSYVS
jgi:hypothetical protein